MERMRDGVFSDQFMICFFKKKTPSRISEIRDLLFAVALFPPRPYYRKRLLASQSRREGACQPNRRRERDLFRRGGADGTNERWRFLQSICDLFLLKRKRRRE